MTSYNGKLLHIDLGSRKTSVEPLSSSFLKNYLGGIGLAVRLLFDYSSPGKDPLSPENPLVWASGAFTGTMVPTSGKHAVAAKSPQTGFVGDSLSSSFWSLALKRAGYDAIVITGACDSLSYLFIDDDIIHIKRATHLAGKGCTETEEAVRREIGDDRVRVAAIGPGGENRVLYASIGNDIGRRAGRAGMGAVMGSKNLKAIAIRGTRAISVANLEEVQKVSERLYQKSQSTATEKYRILGTTGNVLTLNRLAALPTFNFQQSTFDEAENISGEYLYNHNLARVVACAGCPIACEHVYRVIEGSYAGVHGRLDYETLFALGSLCGVSDADTVIKAAERCDYYGIDTISAGGSIAWAMECFQKGLLTNADTEGLDLSFGNGGAVVEMVERIGQRKGLGDLLADGVKKAAARLGMGSESWAMQAKGLEIPGYEPRSLKTMALGYAIGTRGACHNRSSAYEIDMSSKVDRFKGEAGRGPLAAAHEDFVAVMDSLVLCKFLRRCFDDFYTEAAELYTLVTGIETTPADLKLAGERITNLKKAFNIREGWTRKDDWLPSRVFHEALPTGVAKGVHLTEEELKLMIDDYYEARGWTKDGLIPKVKLEELSLADVAERIGAR